MIGQQQSVDCNVKSGTRKAVQDTPSQALSDALVKVATSRDRKAFAYLFEYFAPKIKRFGVKQFGNEAQAMELVQDTMTSVWRKAHLYHHDKGAATTWIYTVMRNASFDALRKMKSNKEEHISEDIWPIIQDSQTDDEGFKDHLQTAQIQKYINKLPPAQRDIVKGVYFQEMSQEQLAEHLNIPVGTVKSRLRLALQKLRAELGDQA
ncbi:sigma-70 family RNA polymerase sigma factor [Pseudoalteromonas peptidolytica]|uniref:RNA polymerase sigma-70 factor, ECF subfamily n=1 Tax=Pseudoalteromonas peptidolytica F12-50-A1 TaxID=1315280 RepID=A0A8I0MZF7_9GAMM|nr:sigma-70 family RNA polymerase sigma factor [Pseudoalteromonas peptidolytica]MBE0348711.1 RNA polymerase sigma-70 factor, ECF subfamily [Pseudoalteromonas peptidolytica F12-50-A1]NLR15124.1 sigma-70 family RNA polymerase sigma factor [Pseudoalteromonas peptidolytica]GEK10479.1 RNA polymerase sigma factor [Pseudoalteromonas peptidolytica]